MRAAAALLSICIVGPLLGQLPARGLRRDGTDLFRAVLSQSGVKALSAADALRDSPRDKVLIVFGDTFPIEGMIRSGELQHFLGNGGSVCVATDRDTSDAFFESTGVKISGEIVPARHRSESYRRRMADCPIVVDHFGDAKRHAIFAAVPTPSNVATNRPSFILANEPPFRRLLDPTLPVAWLPVKYPYRTKFGDLETPMMLAVANTDKRNHLLVIADHSIFINDMLSQPDNDNIAFAYGVVRWLTDDGRRKEVLFIDDGVVQTEFNVALNVPPPKFPPLEALIPLADEAIVAVEKDNLINQALLEAVGGPWTIFRTLAFLLTLGLLFLGLYRFIQARHRPEVRPPSGPPGAADSGLSSVERRNREVIAQGNLAEAARELAHQAFAAVGLDPAAGTPPPTVTVADRLPFRRWGRAREVRRLWNLAVRGPRGRVSPAALRRLDAGVHDLLSSVATGRVRLAGNRSAI
jgi:hypothetical protein